MTAALEGGEYRIQGVTIKKKVNFEALIVSIAVLFIVCHIEASSAVAGSLTACCLVSALLYCL